MNLQPHKFITRQHNSRTVHYFDDDVQALGWSKGSRRTLCGKLKTARSAYFGDGDRVCRECLANAPNALKVPEPSRPGGER